MENSVIISFQNNRDAEYTVGQENKVLGGVTSINYDPRIPETVIVEFEKGQRIYSGYPFIIMIINKPKKKATNI